MVVEHGDDNNLDEVVELVALVELAGAGRLLCLYIQIPVFPGIDLDTVRCDEVVVEMDVVEADDQFGVVDQCGKIIQIVLAENPILTHVVVEHGDDRDPHAQEILPAFAVIDVRSKRLVLVRDGVLDFAIVNNSFRHVIRPFLLE